MTLPKFSIIMPVFNCGKTIDAAIRSILAQDYPDVELIFVDGASTDDTVEIASRYRKHFAHFISERDRGQTDAINKGCRLASGHLFNWLCGDDEFCPGAFHTVARLLRENQSANMVIGASRRIYGKGKEEVYAPRSDVMSRISFFNGIEQPSAFWTLDLHRRAGELDAEIQVGMDWDWWNRLRLAGAQAVTCQDVLSLYFFPETSKTSSAPQANLDISYRVLKKYGPLGGGLADVYMYLFRKYDMQGCYDNPPEATSELVKEWWRDIATLKTIFGDELIYSYNWNWISKQLRGKSWF